MVWKILNFFCVVCFGHVPAAVQDVSTDEYAIGMLTVANQTALHWQLLRSLDGKVLDDLWLTKSE
jgi:hypothetical protein